MYAFRAVSTKPLKFRSRKKDKDVWGFGPILGGWGVKRLYWIGERHATLERFIATRMLEAVVDAVTGLGKVRMGLVFVIHLLFQ